MARALKSTPGTLRAMLDRGVYAPDEFEQWLSDRGWAWQGLDRGDYGMSVVEALWLFTIEDPVRWCETYLIEPDSGDPYRFWDFHKASIRAWDQDVVHQDGAEVGKTREIVALICWGCMTCFGGKIANPTMLVAAPQQTHLNDIIDAVEQQVGASERSARATPLAEHWLKPRRTPHTAHFFRTFNPRHPDQPGLAQVDYRPAGVDGEAFRGVHVNACAIFDEAAKAKNKLQWTEFWRATKHGAKTRAYSVPDGDRSSEYFRLTQTAVVNLPRGRNGFRLFRWRQTDKPAPHWSEDRKAIMVRRYGGEHTPGYQRNVLGEHGQAENPVWSWHDILPNVVDRPGYRLIELHADAEADELSFTAKRIALTMVDGRKTGEEAQIGASHVALKALLKADDAERRRTIMDVVRPFIPGGGGVYWAGADLGERNDPTEIILSEQVGERFEDLVRIKAKGLAYHLQRDLIWCLDSLFDHRPFWGVDLGAAGTTVVKDLQTLDAYAGVGFDERLVGFHFQESVECIDETGEVLRDERDRDDPDKVRTAPAKHWATQCITARLQRGGYALAYDTEAINSMVTQTAREGAKFPIYSKVNDHHPDARRQQMLRRLRAMLDEGFGGPDVFACELIDRSATA